MFSEKSRGGIFCDQADRKSAQPQIDLFLLPSEDWRKPVVTIPYSSLNNKDTEARLWEFGFGEVVGNDSGVTVQIDSGKTSTEHETGVSYEVKRDLSVLLNAAGYEYIDRYALRCAEMLYRSVAVQKGAQTEGATVQQGEQYTARLQSLRNLAGLNVLSAEYRRLDLHDLAIYSGKAGQEHDEQATEYAQLADEQSANLSVANKAAPLHLMHPSHSIDSVPHLSRYGFTEASWRKTSRLISPTEMDQVQSP